MSTMTREERLNLFLNKLVKALEDFYGEGVEVRSITCSKNNGILLHGISIIMPGENITPNLYIDEMFDEYEAGGLFADIVKEIVRLREKFRVTKKLNVDFFNHYDQVKDKLGIRLVNSKMNEDLLKDVPHKEYLDMSIMVEVYVHNEALGNGTILVRKEHCSLWKVSEEELYRDAVSNMELINPPMLLGIEDMLKSMNAGMDLTEVNMDREALEYVNSYMMVLTNKSKVNGASSICYPGMLRKMYERLGGEYYLLPSSIHETIVIGCSNSDTDPSILPQMVKEVNSNHLEPVEILSNNAYRYDSKTDRLVILGA